MNGHQQKELHFFWSRSWSKEAGGQVKPGNQHSVFKSTPVLHIAALLCCCATYCRCATVLCWCALLLCCCATYCCWTPIQSRKCTFRLCEFSIQTRFFSMKSQTQLHTLFRYSSILSENKYTFSLFSNSIRLIRLNRFLLPWHSLPSLKENQKVLLFNRFHKTDRLK